MKVLKYPYHSNLCKSGTQSTGIVLSAHKQLSPSPMLYPPHLLCLVPIHVGLYKQDCLGFSVSCDESLSDLDEVIKFNCGQFDVQI